MPLDVRQQYLHCNTALRPWPGVTDLTLISCSVARILAFSCRGVSERGEGGRARTSSIVLSFIPSRLSLACTLSRSSSIFFVLASNSARSSLISLLHRVTNFYETCCCTSHSRLFTGEFVLFNSVVLAFRQFHLLLHFLHLFSLPNQTQPHKSE